MTLTDRKFGFIPGVGDKRDLLLSVCEGVTLPMIVDMRSWDSNIEDQGKLGSCVAHATTSMLEHLDKKASKPFVSLSRLFVYYNARAIDGLVRSDAGTYVKSAIKAVKRLGVSPERVWPYKENKVFKKPKRKAYKVAKKYGIKRYEKIVGLNGMLQCLANNTPFTFGLPIYASFEPDRNGMIPEPFDGDDMLGGHAMLAVGYDRNKRFFIIKNSWGKEWGNKGYCFIPFNYMRDEADDCWTVTELTYDR